MARSLASKKQYHFVAIIPSFTHGEYWEAISEGIDKAASEMESYNIIVTKLFFDQYNNKAFDDTVRNLLDGKVDGVLIATLFADSVIRLLRSSIIMRSPMCMLTLILRGNISLHILERNLMMPE